MAKAPRVGSVKTRLAVNLSPEHATELYVCLLQDTIALGQSLRGVEVSILCPEPDAEDLRRLVAEDVPVVPQKGRGLAAGLTSVFANFTTGQRRAIAFNSDSPHLPASVLEKAFDLLESNDLVVGPTHDGGYYLVGAKASHPALFKDDGMGTTSALDALMGRAQNLKLSVGFTEHFYDIDVASDLHQLAAELRVAPARAPQTAAWLKVWEAGAERYHTGAGSL